jgi:hypothetical protein
MDIVPQPTFCAVIVTWVTNRNWTSTKTSPNYQCLQRYQWNGIFEFAVYTYFRNVLLQILQNSTNVARLFQINKYIYILYKNRDSLVSIALDYGLDDRGSRVRFPAEARNFSLQHRNVQNGSGSHPASYPMGTRGFFPGGKVVGAWIWPLTSI